MRKFVPPALALCGALALALAAPKAHACAGAYEYNRHCPTTYGSVGAFVSFAFGQRKSFGIGGEFSANHLPDNESLNGYGGFVNGTYYFTDSRYLRLNAGAQGDVTLIGGEAGVSFLSGSSGASNEAATVGPAFGTFFEIPFFLMAAFRVTLPFEGPVHYAVDLGLKIPFVLQGPGFYFPD